MKKNRKEQFVKGLRKTMEQRDRISLVKESTLYYQKGEVSDQDSQKDLVQTVSGSVIPSLKTRYVQGLIGRASDKVYAEKAYLKGMNKRPRRKLTLGNRVTRKKRKRVEGGVGKDTQRVGGQRIRQRIRVVWDNLNRERRKKYRKYRKKGDRGGLKESVVSRKNLSQLIEAREWYRILREVEVNRNTYEVRTRMQTHERGLRRKKWRLEAKYRTRPSVYNRKEARGSEKKTWIEKRVREGLLEEEAEKREGFHTKRREEREVKFRSAYIRREKRVRKKKERRKVAHIRSLLERSKRTRIQPLERKNRVQRFKGTTPFPLSPIPVNGEDQESFQQKDEEVEILRALPTTQYFAKVKNLTRRCQRGSDQVDEKGNPTTESVRVKKRRKVPEKKRNQRYPHWTELELWSNQFIQKVEDANLQKVLKGEEVNLSYATYRELGKKVVYFYAVERSEREGKNEENRGIKKKD